VSGRPKRIRVGTVTAGAQTAQLPDGWGMPRRHPDDPDYYAPRAWDNGIPHDPECTLPMGVAETHRASGEVVFTCGWCKSRAIWFGGVLRPRDPEEDERQVQRRRRNAETKRRDPGRPALDLPATLSLLQIAARDLRGMHPPKPVTDASLAEHLERGETTIRDWRRRLGGVRPGDL
jgi:hypothetical protein